MGRAFQQLIIDRKELDATEDVALPLPPLRSPFSFVAVVQNSNSFVAVDLVFQSQPKKRIDELDVG